MVWLFYKGVAFFPRNNRVYVIPSSQNLSPQILNSVGQFILTLISDPFRGDDGPSLSPRLTWSMSVMPRTEFTISLTNSTSSFSPLSLFWEGKNVPLADFCMEYLSHFWCTLMMRSLPSSHKGVTDWVRLNWNCLMWCSCFTESRLFKK